jgi:proteasome lid subunit RPN8/RPN11
VYRTVAHVRPSGVPGLGSGACILDECPPPTELRLDRRLYDTAVAHLLAAAPLEGVGLLAVVAEGAAARGVRFYPGTNVDGSPTRYTMEPAEVLAAFRDIDANGWHFGAIIHSHPATPPVPSPTDLREAFYPEALLVIVGLTGQAQGTPGAPSPVGRAWRLVPDPAGVAAGATAAVEVPLVVDDRGVPAAGAPGERGSR